MAWRFARANRLNIKAEIYRLIRSFPTTYVLIKRVKDVYNEHGEIAQEYIVVYKGTALVRPSGGSSQTYGLGTVENYDLVILINGKQDIRQSDVVTINDGREYDVTYPPGHFDAFMELKLTQRSQITQALA